MATLLGVSVLDNDPLGSIAAHLRSQQMLNVGQLRARGRPGSQPGRAHPTYRSQVQILATSREPLMAASEIIVRLAPLACPTDSTSLTAADAMQYASIELFVERAMNSAEAFELADENALLVANVCRHLDGIPLAIATYCRFGGGRRLASPFPSLPLKLLSVSYEFGVGGNEYSLPSLVVAVAGLPRVGT
jgi:hypothetical protein